MATILACFYQCESLFLSGLMLNAFVHDRSKFLLGKSAADIGP